MKCLCLRASVWFRSSQPARSFYPGLLAAGSWVMAIATVACLFMPTRVSAQELEPGAYWPLPTGLNIVTVVNNFNWGDVAFDPAAPIDEASARVNTTALSFTRAFGLAGRSANVGVA